MQNPKSFDKFIIIGLPAAGKTTAYRAIQSKLKQDGFSFEIINSDNLIKDKMTIKDDVFRDFIKSHNLILNEERYDFASSKSAFFIAEFGETLFRDLEAEYIKHFFAKNNADMNVMYDLGGKAPLHKEIKQIIKDYGFRVIYLNPSKERSALNLKQDYENNQIRGNFHEYIKKEQAINLKQFNKDEEIQKVIEFFGNFLRKERHNKYDSLASDVIIYNNLKSKEIADLILNVVNGQKSQYYSELKELKPDYTLQT